MNQPTREEFERLEAEQLLLKEEVRKLKEQATEPMKVTRIELDPGGIQNRLDNHAEMMKELAQQSDLHTAAFQRVETLLNAHTESISRVQGDGASIKATQSDHGEMLQEVRSTLASVVASKGNVNAIDTRVHIVEQSVKRIEHEHGEMLREILARLPEKGE